MINRRLILIFFVLFFASPLWAGEINSVVSEGNILKIQLTEKSEFKKIPQEDPFKLKIEIQNTKPGILNKKMLFHEGIVSEVYAQEGDKGSIIEILLAEPSETEIKAEGNVLVFSFNKEAKKATSSQIPKIIDLTMEKTDEGFEISIQGDIDLPEPSVVKDEKYINVEFSKVKFEAEPSRIFLFL
jgi:hypothetical protein